MKYGSIACLLLAGLATPTFASQLSRDELLQLISGKTVGLGIGGSSIYGTDGRYKFMFGDGRVNEGNYYVGDGTICVRFDNGHARCDKIEKVGTAYFLTDHKGEQFPFEPR